MAKVIKTLKGETIDWDLLKIKQEIAKTPISIEVKERKEHIDNKLRRKIKKAKDSLINKSKEVVEIKEPIKEPIEQEVKNAIVDLPKTQKTTRKINKNDKTTT